MSTFIVAVDGPSGTGKGTIASHVARNLGLYYLDTGLFYRGVALSTIFNDIDITDTESIVKVAEDMKIDFDGYTTYLDNRDVSLELRSNEVNAIVSQVSSILEVRVKVNKLIRDYCLEKQVIVDGRDIATVVFPDADVKIYLDASIDTRARRRFNQNIEMGIECTYEDVFESIRKRDEIDRNKKYGALKIAGDAKVVDTTNISIEETLEIVTNIIEGEMK